MLELDQILFYKIFNISHVVVCLLGFFLLCILGRQSSMLKFAKNTQF